MEECVSRAPLVLWCCMAPQISRAPLMIIPISKPPQQCSIGQGLTGGKCSTDPQTSPTTNRDPLSCMEHRNPYWIGPHHECRTLAPRMTPQTSRGPTLPGITTPLARTGVLGMTIILKSLHPVTPGEPRPLQGP